jgi:hypothetical protein
MKNAQVNQCCFCAFFIFNFSFSLLHHHRWDDNARRMKRTLLAIILVLLFALPLFAWGEAGHLLVNEAATHGTTPDLPRFFHDHYPQLVYLGPDPDRWRGRGESLDALSSDHFLDSEFVDGLTLPPHRYQYIQLLTDANVPGRRGIKLDDPGFLPWRIAEMAELLEVQWRLWRRSASPEERGQIEQNIIQLAGTMGHYVADAGNPHHTTMNYNGWIEPNPRGFATDCDTHSRFESQFVSRVVSIDDLRTRLRPMELQNDYFKTALAFVRESQALVPALYEMDRAGGFRGTGTAESRSFAAGRMAAAAALLRDLWVSAYRNSGESH